MKKILFAIVICFPILCNGQLHINLQGTTIKKISSNISENTPIELLYLRLDVNGNYFIAVRTSTTSELISYSDIDKISFTPATLKDFWENHAFQYSTYNSLLKNGFQYKLRDELDEDAVEYGNRIKKDNLDFEDLYLESYIYSLINRIYPSQLDDRRPGAINLTIIKNSTPNAFIFPNGSLFITTGLLSTINTEEELIAVLAHEISHFVLDHHITNVNKAIQRQKNAEFWASIATGIAAAVDIYGVIKGKYYLPGLLTMNTAILATSIVSALNERMGLKYSKEQEIEADNCTIELLKFIKINPNALSSVLNKILQYLTANGNYYALTEDGTYPALMDRLNKLGDPIPFLSVEYDRKISFVNSFNSILEFNNRHFISCISLAERNIIAGIGTEDDYVILAMVNLFMYDTDSKNKEALDLISKAKTLNIYSSINILKQESIALIRLKMYKEAKDCLNKYKESLNQEKQNIGSINNDNEWIATFSYINNELEWTAKMINKVNLL
ncbi:MAG: M48 family metallopeptidase [Bacteroidota bacterium]|nr:M48 family metallopeptidase [Bacteroidota bacterium]